MTIHLMVLVGLKDGNYHNIDFQISILLFLAFLLGHHYTFQVGSVDHSPVDLELAEGIVNLAGTELLSPGHQRVSEHLGVNLTVDLEGFKGSDNHIVVISSSRHLLGEQGDHLGEVDRAGGLAYQVVGFGIRDWSSDTDEGGLQVVGCDDSILVHVNDSKSFLDVDKGKQIQEFKEAFGIIDVDK